ncbi:MAG: hypothetical protein R2706_09835 [Acidimicrobiales bacterium]
MNQNLCGKCAKELVSIAIKVDGRDLVMYSCQNCDTRTWSLAGESIALATALEQVGEHSGRRR